MQIQLNDILKAREVIKPYISRTHLDYSNQASKRLGRDIFLKFENRQRTGSFKIRGAANKLLGLTPEERKKGVIAYSAGNHAQGVASVAQQLGIKCVIVMPQASPLVKVTATKSYGAEVHLVGQVVDESFQYLLELQKKHGYILVHPYEDSLVVAGQGTIGAEILEDMPDLEAVFIPIGGGGIISGVATAIKLQKPQVQVVGVQASGADAMYRFFKSGKAPEFTAPVSTIADGIAVKYPSKVMYESFIKKLVDDVITVEEDEIAEAMVFLMETEKVIVEGAGAAALAGLFSGKSKIRTGKTAVVLSGGNVDSNLLEKVVERGLQRSGRLITINVRVPDIPGSLTKLTSVIAQERANILQIIHNRVSDKLLIRETMIELTLETTGSDHIELIKKGLQAAGAVIL